MNRLNKLEGPTKKPRSMEFKKIVAALMLAMATTTFQGGCEPKKEAPYVMDGDPKEMVKNGNLVKYIIVDNNKYPASEEAGILYMKYLGEIYEIKDRKILNIDGKETNVLELQNTDNGECSFFVHGKNYPGTSFGDAGGDKINVYNSNTGTNTIINIKNPK